MIGLDTSFLVAFEDSSHALHSAARALAVQHSGEGFALAPQVLAEFLHVVTDSRRFSAPLSMEEGLIRTARWWGAHEVRHVAPDAGAIALFHEWMSRHNLGRKRLLDTLLAATYLSAGAGVIATSNWRDFALFPGVHALVL